MTDLEKVVRDAIYKRIAVHKGKPIDGPRLETIKRDVMSVLRDFEDFLEPEPDREIVVAHLGQGRISIAVIEPEPPLVGEFDI